MDDVKIPGHEGLSLKFTNKSLIEMMDDLNIEYGQELAERAFKSVFAADLRFAMSGVKHGLQGGEVPPDIPAAQLCPLVADAIAIGLYGKTLEQLANESEALEDKEADDPEGKSSAGSDSLSETPTDTGSFPTSSLD